MRNALNVLPAYPIAEQVANNIMPHFVRHLTAAGKGIEQPGPLPDGDTVASIINAAFWASLRREEGFAPKISLAYVPPDIFAHPLRFSEALPLLPDSLARLAPAVERAGIHLGVWGGPEELFVWGTTRSLPPYCFVLEVISPGLLVLKHSPGDASGKFGNVAVLEGDKIKIVAVPPNGLRNGSIDTRSFLEIASIGEPGAATNVLPQLAVSMRAHGRGGTLLRVANDSADWRESIRSMSYSVEPFSELAQLMRSIPGDTSRSHWQKNLRQSIDAIAGLTAVDGATVMTHDYRVLGFGAKIRRRGNFPAVDKVLLTEAVENSVGEVVDPAQLGGTRHLSAAQFAHDQHEAFALVASQDGRFTLLAWSRHAGMVQAHRIESLLV